MTLQEILESVKSGSVSVEEAERILKKESYEEMGYAKLDTSRKARTGFAEVIYCSNKADEHLLNIFERLYREDGEVFGTRASQHQYELVKEKFPNYQLRDLSHSEYPIPYIPHWRTAANRYSLLVSYVTGIALPDSRN